MRRSVGSLVAIFCTFLLCAQAQILRPPPVRHHAESLGLARSGSLLGIPTRGLEFFITMGCDGGENPGCNWTHRAENLLAHSADLTEWTNSGCVVAATTVEDDNGAVSEYIQQNGVAPDATTYTWTISVQKDAVVPATRFPRFTVGVGALYHVRLDTSSGATTETAGLGGSHTVTSEIVDGIDCWKLAITFTTDDANGISVYVSPARGANANLTTESVAAVGEITILRQQLTPGTSSGTYRATGARQRVWDWSGNARHAQVGSAAGSDTNDPGDKVWRKNLLADGSTEDLENAVFAHTATIDDATHLTFAAQHQYCNQGPVTVEGVSYTLSFKVRRITGNTALHFTHNGSATGSITSLTVDDILTRYSVTVLGKTGGGPISLGIQDRNAAGHGQIEITEWQVEVGALSDYSAADRMVVAGRGEFTTDDYLQVTNATGVNPTGAVTLFALFKSSDAGANKDVISKHRGGSSFSYQLRLNSSEKLALKLNGPSDTVITGATSITDDQWHLGVGVYDGAFLHVYLDGVSDATPEASTGSINYTTDDFYVGQLGNSTNFMEGVIPAAGMYSRALSASEVLRLYNTVRAWWNLDRRGKRNLTLP